MGYEFVLFYGGGVFGEVGYVGCEGGVVFVEKYVAGQCGVEREDWVFGEIEEEGVDFLVVGGV